MSLSRVFSERRDEAPFLIFVSFLISFLVARSWILLDVGDPLPGTETYMIHHPYLGIALLAVAAWLAINYERENIYLVAALLYGAGLGVFFDEIGSMLTHFEDYYSSITYTAVVAISLLLLNTVFFRDFWRAVSSDIGAYAKERRLRYGPLNLMGVVNMLEELDERMPGAGQVTVAFTGMVLIATGFMILEYPQLIKYWIGGALVLSGFSYIVRGLKEWE